eukprot:scaffold17718_cov81-Phaeocystis_antarctica.AAC.1
MADFSEAFPEVRSATRGNFSSAEPVPSVQTCRRADLQSYGGTIGPLQHYKDAIGPLQPAWVLTAYASVAHRFLSR